MTKNVEQHTILVVPGLDPGTSWCCASLYEIVIAGPGPGDLLPRGELPYYVYIMTNRPNGTLYIGVTNDLVRRAYEHRTKTVPGFTTRYNLSRLVYFEQAETAMVAIQREKNMKHWSRAWKVQLIERVNPAWRDLYEDIASP